MTKDVLLWYICPCGKNHDIGWSIYKQLVDKRLKCNCDLIAEIISKNSK